MIHPKPKKYRFNASKSEFCFDAVTLAEACDLVKKEYPRRGPSFAGQFFKSHLGTVYLNTTVMWGGKGGKSDYPGATISAYDQDTRLIREFSFPLPAFL
jgi:hypothetical protein